MSKYKMQLILLLIIIYFVLCFLEISFKNVLKKNIEEQIGYLVIDMENGIEKTTLELERVVSTYYDSSLHDSSNVRPELEFSKVKNSDGKLVIDKKEVIENLSNYVQINDLFSDAYFASENGEIIAYTASSTYDDKIVYQSLNERDLTKVTKTFVKKGICGEPAMLLSYPVYNKDDICLGSINFEAAFSKLKKYFSEYAFKYENCFITVETYDGEEIYSNMQSIDLISDKYNYILKLGEKVENNYNMISKEGNAEGLLNFTIMTNERVIIEKLYGFDYFLICIGLVSIVYAAMYVSMIDAELIKKILIYAIGVLGLVTYFCTIGLTRETIFDINENFFNKLTQIYQYDTLKEKENIENKLNKLNEIFSQQGNFKEINKKYHHYIRTLTNNTIYLVNSDDVIAVFDGNVIHDESLRNDFLQLYEQHKGDKEVTYQYYNDDFYLCSLKVENSDVILFMLCPLTNIKEYFKLLDGNLLVEDDDVTSNKIESFIKLVNAEKNRIAFITEKMPENIFVKFGFGAENYLYVAVANYNFITSTISKTILKYDLSKFNFSKRLFNCIGIISFAIYGVCIYFFKHNSILQKNVNDDIGEEKLAEIERKLSEERD